MADPNNSQQYSFKSLEEVFQVYFVKAKITKNMRKEISLVKQAQERVKKQFENRKEKQELEQQSNANYNNSELSTKISNCITGSPIEVSKNSHEESIDNLPPPVTYWKCQHCTLHNKDDVYVCTACLETNEDMREKIENQWTCLNCTTVNVNDNYICQMCSKSDAKIKTKIGNTKGALSKSKNQPESTYPSPIADYENDDPYNQTAYNHNPQDASIQNWEDVQNAFDTPMQETENNSMETDNYPTSLKISEIQENVGQLVDSTTTKGGFMRIVKNILSYFTGSKSQKAHKIEKMFKELIENNSWETLDDEIKKIYRRLVAKGLSDEDMNGYHLAILKYIMPEIEDHFVIYMYKENNFKIEATLKELLQVMTMT